MTEYLKLLLIRHGESVGNCEHRLEGQTSTALSTEGKRQTQRLAVYLQSQTPPTCLYTSPLQRALETASPLQVMTGCPMRLEPDLQEIHQGIFEGLTWAQVSERYPDLCHQLMTTLEYQPVPEAENVTAAYQRARTWYSRLWQQHTTGNSIWVVSHAGFMQHLVAVILGCDRTWQLPIRNTALFEFWLIKPTPSSLSSSNRHNPECWKVVKFNETPHLESAI